MPVTSFRGTSSAAAPPPQAAAPPPAPAAPAAPAASGVGHGTTRLIARKTVYGQNAPLVPGTPPPRGETAGAHGAHKGRISIR
jgi:hypothetical protein